MNFSYFSPFVGEFFAIFTVWGWILFIFHLFSVNSLQFLPFYLEFFAFFILWGWILCNFLPSMVNSLHFSFFKGEFFCIFFHFKGEFFAFFTLEVEFFAVFTLWEWILCNFHPSRVKFFQFLPSWGIFCVSGLGFSIWNSACVLFCHKSPVFFWVICWHFLFFKRVSFYNFYLSGIFWDENGQKVFL